MDLYNCFDIPIQIVYVVQILKHFDQNWFYVCLFLFYKKLHYLN